MLDTQHVLVHMRHVACAGLVGQHGFSPFCCLTIAGSVDISMSLTVATCNQQTLPITKTQRLNQKTNYYSIAVDLETDHYSTAVIQSIIILVHYRVSNESSAGIIQLTRLFYYVSYKYKFPQVFIIIHNLLQILLITFVTEQLFQCKFTYKGCHSEDRLR